MKNNGFQWNWNFKKVMTVDDTYIRVAVAEIGKGRIFDSGLGLSKGQARKTATRQTYNRKS
jgi:hypothetical protein